MNNIKALELEKIIRKDYSNIAGIAATKNTDVVFENYFHDYTEYDPIHIASVTKSIISILVGIAIDKGYIESTDWTKASLDLLGGKTLSGDFKYTTIGLQVLSGILTNATNRSILDFASENLFTP